MKKRNVIVSTTDVIKDFKFTKHIKPFTTNVMIIRSIMFSLGFVFVFSCTKNHNEERIKFEIAKYIEIETCSYFEENLIDNIESISLDSIRRISKYRFLINELKFLDKTKDKYSKGKIIGFEDSGNKELMSFLALQKVIKNIDSLKKVLKETEKDENFNQCFFSVKNGNRKLSFVVLLDDNLIPIDCPDFNY